MFSHLTLIVIEAFRSLISFRSFLRFQLLYFPSSDDAKSYVELLSSNGIRYQAAYYRSWKNSEGSYDKLHKSCWTYCLNVKHSDKAMDMQMMSMSL